MSHQTSNDHLSVIFDLEPMSDQSKEIISTEGQYLETTNTAEKEQDFQYVRSNLYGLIDKGTEAIANALSVANESQHPRAYEVAGNLIKNIADLTDKLVSLQKTKQALSPQEDSSSSKNINIDKAVFVGSTAELLKMIKNESNDN